MMKNKILFFMGLCLLSGPLFTQQVSVDAQAKQDTLAFERLEDSPEYEIRIIDPGFEMFLVSEAKPKEFYSQAYYENWNRQYVLEWNIRYNQVQYAHIIESYIDYDPATDYGLEVNYQLYNYFLFFEKKYQVKLVNRGR